MEQVVVARVDGDFLRIYILIMDIMSEGNIKTNSTYEDFSGFHRSLISVLVSDALVKSSIVCNVAL